MKVNIICSLGENPAVGGQTIKTQELIKFLDNKADVGLTDLHNIKMSPLKALLRIFKGLLECDKCIMILASTGHFIIVPYIFGLNLFLKKPIYEIVIGGIRQDYIEGHRIRKYFESKMEKIYVESNHMVSEYRKLGLKNVAFMPNYKNINPVTNESVLQNKKRAEIKICTFSRIDKYKGIDEAINIVNRCNEKSGSDLIKLDIIGPVDEKYQNEFNDIMCNQKKYIRYRGVVESHKSVEVLSEYDILLAPTKWKAEGFPGAYIDAMSAGLVILTTDLENFKDIVTNGENGYLITDNNTDLYVGIINSLYLNRDTLYDLRIKSLMKADMFQAENVLDKLYKDIEMP